MNSYFLSTAMTNCVKCNKKPKKNSKLDENKVCVECNKLVNIPPGGPGGIEDEKSMGDISFGDFKSWLTNELRTLVKAIALEEMADTKKEVADLKKKNKELSDKLTAAENKVTETNKEIAAVKASLKEVKDTTDNNLKYLINVDRNGRKHNVILFGVQEKEDLRIGNKSAATDHQKCQLLLEYIGCNQNTNVVDSFRLGKEVNAEKPRPIKISFSEKNMAFDVLAKTAKLKELKDSHRQNVYIKPDKTKAEVAEFQRLGKKKDELLTKYPTVDDDNPRVVLTKGSLKVDGVELDKYQPVQSLF